MSKDSTKDKEGKIIHINEEQIKDHLGEMVRGTVEETLNEMLEQEAEQLVGAERYERTEGRKDTRAGHYNRNLETKAGKVRLRVPKLRNLSFETAIIERYKRREASVEEALIEMYLAGVSVRRVEDITQALWGTRVSPGTVSKLNKKIYGSIEQGRMKELKGHYPFIYLDGISVGSILFCSSLFRCTGKDGNIGNACIEGIKKDIWHTRLPLLCHCRWDSGVTTSVR